MMQKLTHIAVYLPPYLFALFPFLFLYAHNASLFQFGEMVFPILVALIATSALLALLRFLSRSATRASIAASSIVLYFFAYGHIFDALTVPLAKNSFLAGHTILLSLVTLLPSIIVISIVVYMLRSKRKLQTLNTFALSFGAVLVGLSLIQIGSIVFAKANSASLTDASSQNLRAEQLTSTTARPDIYYIILDGYGRADVLEDIYAYDSTDFFACLKDNDFFVAKESVANYAQTPLSMAASLNMRYLDAIAETLGPDSQNRQVLKDEIASSIVSQKLQQLGYTYIHFVSPYILLTGVNKNADLNIDTASDALSPFEYALLHTTFLRPFLEEGIIATINQTENHIDRTLNSFDYLTEIPAIDEPTFTLMHILAPHPPFIFDQNGNTRTDSTFFRTSDGSHWWARDAIGTQSEYVEQYREQVTFVGKKLCETVEGILEHSEEKPIIILQGDHGPGSQLDWEDPHATNLQERMGILNAYHLPHEGNKKLYPTITPVNTFRVIFNHYFGDSAPLLEDRAYFSIWEKPYDFIPVTADFDIGESG